MQDDGLAYGARLARHYAASAALALLSDAELADRVAAAEVVGAGIGGVTARLDVGGTAVFIKRIPLTDLERRPEHVRSTANLHGTAPALPVRHRLARLQCAAGRRPDGVAPELADMIVRHAPVAAVMNDFYWQLFEGVHDTPYPAAEVARALTR